MAEPVDEEQKSRPVVLEGLSLSIEALAKLTKEERARVIRTVAAFYGFRLSVEVGGFERSVR